MNIYDRESFFNAIFETTNKLNEHLASKKWKVHISFTFHVSYLQINAVIQEVYTFYNFLYAAQGYSSKNSIILSAISNYGIVPKFNAEKNPQVLHSRLKQPGNFDHLQWRWQENIRLWAMVSVGHARNQTAKLVEDKIYETRHKQFPYWLRLL